MGKHKEKAGVVKLGCFCAAARGTHCSDQTVCGSLTWWACGHDTTAHQNTPNVTMIRKTQPIPFWFFACTLYTRNNYANFTTAFNMSPWIYYFYQVSSIKRKQNKKKTQNTLKLHCSECCPVGFVDVVVAAGQCSHPRLKEPLCFLLDNECKLHQKYFSLFSCCFSSTFTCTSFIGLCCLPGFLGLHVSSLDPVELMLQVMSINSM